VRKRVNPVKKATKESPKQFQDAEKSLHRMLKEIEPYIKHKKFESYSTDGKWYETSSRNFVSID